MHLVVKVFLFESSSPGLQLSLPQLIQCTHNQNPWIAAAKVNWHPPVHHRLDDQYDSVVDESQLS
jgi:hypothetical protein